MPFYINDQTVSLEMVCQRIKHTDLVPSRAVLMEEIDHKFDLLQKQGIQTLADLRKKLKQAKNIPSFAKLVGVDQEYLKLLRREVEGYFPKAAPLSDFNGVDPVQLTKLEDRFKNSVVFYDETENLQRREELLQTLNLAPEFLNHLFALVDLTRIQWMSPIAARLVYEAGYPSVQAAAGADAQVLCEKVDQINQENHYFKGKIGLRDIQRLVKAAQYLL